MRIRFKFYLCESQSCLLWHTHCFTSLGICNPRKYIFCLITNHMLSFDMLWIAMDLFCAYFRFQTTVRAFSYTVTAVSVSWSNWKCLCSRLIFYFIEEPEVAGCQRQWIKWTKHTRVVTWAPFPLEAPGKNIHCIFDHTA